LGSKESRFHIQRIIVGEVAWRSDGLHFKVDVNDLIRNYKRATFSEFLVLIGGCYGEEGTVWGFRRRSRKVMAMPFFSS
jgi:hypothetical protein